MSTYGFFTESNSDSCVKATAPVVNQAFLDILETTGDTPQDLLAEIPAASLAAHSGMLHNRGCMSLEVVATYVDGADCDACTSDTLVTTDVTFYVEKNAQGFVLPAGLVSQIQVTTGDLDGTGTFTAAPVPVGQTQKLSWNSCYQPCCGTSVAVPA